VFFTDLTAAISERCSRSIVPAMAPRWMPSPVGPPWVSARPAAGDSVKCSDEARRGGLAVHPDIEQAIKTRGGENFHAVLTAGDHCRGHPGAAQSFQQCHRTGERAGAGLAKHPVEVGQHRAAAVQG
jgi:hypothetical protein